MSDQTGANLIIDNKPGAGTFIGAADVAHAPADGHTLLYTIVVTHTQNPHLYNKLPYDAFKDFTPVVQLVRSATVLVANRNAPFNNVREMVSYAKQHPGALNFASYSLGSTSHLNGEILQQRAGIEMVHVPYKGTADATRALLAGDVQVYFDGTATAVERARRQGQAAWRGGRQAPGGLAGPAHDGGTGRAGARHRRLAGRVWARQAAASHRPENRHRIPHRGGIARYRRNDPFAGQRDQRAGPDAFKQIVANDYERWGAVIKRIGLKLD